MSGVFVITSGSYSDKQNLRAFSTREKAEEWVGVLGADGHYGIEELELDDMTNKPRAGLWGSILMETGDVSRLDHAEIFDSMLVTMRINNDWHHSVGRHMATLEMYFNHLDRNGAAKVLAEKRAQLLAQPGPVPCGIYDRETMEASK